MRRFDHKHLFENEIKKGINLFLGAGFSILATNKRGLNLPVGNSLNDLVKEKFNMDKSSLNLSQISTILANSKKQEFYSFLREVFTVSDFDKGYFNVDKLNPKNIYTTNIDDLIYKIYEGNEEKYINDVTYHGEIFEDLAINFSALHGNVRYPDDREMIFDVSSISNAYSSNFRIWNQLALDFEKRITLFWGYSLQDTAVIQSLTSSNTNPNFHKEKWIIVKDNDSHFIEYLNALGFNIIISDTKSFLNYLNELKIEKISRKEKIDEEIKYLFGKNIIPKSNKNLPVRPILDFFSGNPPTWYDIFSNQIHKTSHFSKIKDFIYSNKNLIIQGAPVSGKTTLIMQVAIELDYEIKLIFENLQYNKAQLLAKVIKDRKAVIFIDNFSDSIESFNYLSDFKNIKLIGIERTHNFSAISHLIKTEFYNICNVTELTENDLQGIFNHLPIENRKTNLAVEKNKNYEKDTIFEFVRRNVKGNTIKERFVEVFKDIEKDRSLTDFLVLTAYTHNCRVPISFDMLYSYFIDDVKNYKDIYILRDKLRDLVKDYSGDLILEDNQDYFYPRSYFIAETIIDTTPSDVLKNVMIKTLDNIPNTKIPYYNVYRKYAYDKILVSKAFFNWSEGMKFYQKVYDMDFHNPYVLQQGALYLAYKKKFTTAFEWIDRAITQTNNKYFSIRNSHAIILFDANINSTEESTSIRAQLDKSMDILEKCINDDKRKVFHAIRYAEQAKEYFNRFYDEKSVAYIRKAKEWLRREYKDNKWDKNLFNTLQSLETIKL
ncbi:SIR2 family protein [Capnocytophaga ochracea]|uniref:SIR2 family protein n=1 Tax=Capnocytophaga ochracea TaxID=1018 RepID=UPI0022320E63|nr:SIR2 family protein [Capnocytophaga ochracea]UZD37891.1 SIR2 family protein [Capnocytophaga ochracea]